jgi:hypothetical protein
VQPRRRLHRWPQSADRRRRREPHCLGVLAFPADAGTNRDAGAGRYVAALLPREIWPPPQVEVWRPAPDVAVFECASWHRLPPRASCVPPLTRRAIKHLALAERQSPFGPASSAIAPSDDAPGTPLAMAPRERGELWALSSIRPATRTPARAAARSLCGVPRRADSWHCPKSVARLPLKTGGHRARRRERRCPKDPGSCVQP